MRRLLYSVNGPNLASIWKSTSNMFVSLRISSLMNGLYDPIDHRTRVAFGDPVRPIPTIEGRGRSGREGRVLGKMSEHWRTSGAKDILIHLVQEVLYVHVHVPKWIKWLIEKRMAMARRPGERCACKNLVKEREWIAEIEVCVMGHEGIREGIASGWPASLKCWRCGRPPWLCRRGPNPMRIVFLALLWINQYFVCIVNLSELFL